MCLSSGNAPLPPPQEGAQCLIYQNAKLRDEAQFQCYSYCKSALNEAKEESRTSNYGCVGFLDQALPQRHPLGQVPGTSFYVAPGTCSCDNYLVNEIADTALEAMPIIAQISCYMLMSSLKLVLDVGWLSPCGGTELVPDEIKKIFGILGSVVDGVSSFKKAKTPKGSGKKGNDASPIDRSRPKQGTGSGANELSKTEPGSGGIRKKCNVPRLQSTLRKDAAKNTMRRQSCVASKTQKEEIIVTSLTYGACATQAAATTTYRQDASATATWSSQHRGSGWIYKNNRQWPRCDRDEYPPAYLLDENNPAFVNLGVDRTGQLVRFIPNTENQRAGQMWKGACFGNTLKELSDTNFDAAVSRAPASAKHVSRPNSQLLRTYVAIGVNTHPEFTISSFGHSGSPPANDGLDDYQCWPSGIAAADPGFALLAYDAYYDTHHMPYRYDQAYVQGANGSWSSSAAS
ncbi:hypothetical protein LZ31DRAFT_542332 [Colletotrichum somersetense]|nr:hypothetical protein LZ31DRAFT_542332 [Colletotrichum somersetense]